MPVDLDEFVLAKLAREMAMSIRPAAAVLNDYGLDETTFYEITKNPFYRRAKEQFSLEWHSALSVNERVKLISASLLEQALPKLSARMVGNEPLAAAADVAKLFARNAGLGDVKAESKSSERFQITINLGADTEVYDKALAIAQASAPIDDANGNGQEELPAAIPFIRRPRPTVQKARCSVDGCDKPARTRGMCSVHYQRQYYRENPRR